LIPSRKVENVHSTLYPYMLTKPGQWQTEWQSDRVTFYYNALHHNEGSKKHSVAVESKPSNSNICQIELWKHTKRWTVAHIVSKFIVLRQSELVLKHCLEVKTSYTTEKQYFESQEIYLWLLTNTPENMTMILHM